MAVSPRVSKIAFAFQSANFTAAVQPQRSWAIKRTVAAGGVDNPDPSTFGYDPGMAKTANGTLVLFHKQGVTTGDVKVGVGEVNDSTIAIPFTNSTLSLPGWNMDLRIFNTDAAAQTYVAVFAPDETSLLNNSFCLADWDMTSTGLVVRQNDNIVFRQILLCFFKSSSFSALPVEIPCSVMTGTVANLNYPMIATRRLVGTRLSPDWSEANLLGNNPIVVYGLESPLFIRGSDATAGKNQASTQWVPFLYAPFKGLGPTPFTLNYLFRVVGEIYRGANAASGFLGGG
jgi:hypothetical protein